MSAVSSDAAASGDEHGERQQPQHELRREDVAERDATRDGAQRPARQLGDGRAIVTGAQHGARAEGQRRDENGDQRERREHPGDADPAPGQVLRAG